jgi:Ca-activated chloride channel family protein
LNFEFQYPQAFWLLILVPIFILLYVFYQLWKKKRIQNAGDARLIRLLIKNHAPAKATLKFSLVLLAFVLGCVAVANPRKTDENSAEERKGIDLVIAMDVSNSMLATDVSPDRLTRAKQFVSKLIDQLKDDRIGLVEFAGNAYLQMPLTFDQSAARLYVSVASPAAIAAQGTSISDALQKAGIAFGEEEERFRSVVLITDGETHDENAIEKAKELASKGVMINTIGIGSPEGSTIADTATGQPKTDESGHVIVSKLNQPLLQQLATISNGKYVHLENPADAANEIMEQYKDIEKKALGDTSLYTYKTFYGWLLIPALLLLLIELFISDRKKQLA